MEVYTNVNKALEENPPISPVPQEGQSLPDVLWEFTKFVPIDQIRAVIVSQDPGDPKYSCGVAFSYPEMRYNRWIPYPNAVHNIMEAIKIFAKYDKSKIQNMFSSKYYRETLILLRKQIPTLLKGSV